MGWKVSCLGEGGVEGDETTAGVVDVVVVLEGDWLDPTHSATHWLDTTHTVTHRMDSTHSVTHRMDSTHTVTHRKHPTHSVSSQSTGRPSLERRILAKNLEHWKV